MCRLSQVQDGSQMPSGPALTAPRCTTPALTSEELQETLRLLPATTQDCSTFPPTGPLQNRQQQVGQTRFWNPHHHLQVEPILHRTRMEDQGKDQQEDQRETRGRDRGRTRGRTSKRTSRRTREGTRERTSRRTSGRNGGEDQGGPRRGPAGGPAEEQREHVRVETSETKIKNPCVL